ncbi:MarR family transcriptional regulator [Flexivirga endophytica]|uniref:MarR family transcriptional regulator n=1 Tax=Flexivirga endophytica TaxID=1849103 RepID=A0A916SUL7_9MICO|nr:MarR family transcriptional regulator [Flexivirga endophytica]GGB18403.1 MarR family transcriptional regulator [Flexivirga endophytica]GHB37249.1 MarR family transcriptional regulator [Flexivirga endophytica]
MDDETFDPLALENQVCYSLALAARGVIGAYREVLAPLGLTHPQYLVMLALWQDEPRSNRELAQALRLDPGTLSPLLKRLARADYVTKARDASDERTLAVRLTPRGRELRDRAVNVPLIMIRRLGLEDRDLGALNDVLHGLIEAADHPAEVTSAERRALVGTV